METINKHPQNIAAEPIPGANPPETVTHLVGPDGWQFSVSAPEMPKPGNALDSYTLPVPPALEAVEDVEQATADPNVSSFLGERNEPSEPVWRRVGKVAAAVGVAYAAQRGINTEAARTHTEYVAQRTIEHGGNAANASVIAFHGLRKSLNERRARKADKKIDHFSQSSQAYREAGAIKIRHSTHPEDTPTGDTGPESSPYGRPFEHGNKFISAHRTRRDLSSVGDEYEDLSFAGDPTTLLQERAGLRASRRFFKAKEEAQVANGYRMLYGDLMDRTKEELESHIKAGNYTRAKARAMRGAHRIVRHADHIEHAEMEKLDKSARGGDMPGLLSNARLASAEQTKDSAETKAAEAEQKQTIARVKREQRRLDRARRRANP